MVKFGDQHSWAIYWLLVKWASASRLFLKVGWMVVGRKTIIGSGIIGEDSENDIWD